MIEVKADRFNRGLDLLQKWLDTQFTQDALVFGSKQLAVSINNRVENNSTKADGSQWGGYSTKTTLVGRKSFETQAAWEDVLSKVGKDSPIHWVTLKKGATWAAASIADATHLIVLPGGYAEIRRLDGHLNSKKNFSRTRMMWRSFGIKGSEKDIVYIGGKTKESQNKINWNTQRENENIIAASQKEADELSKYVNLKVQKKIKEFFA